MTKEKIEIQNDRRWIALAGFYFVVALGGVLQVFDAENANIYWLLSILTSVSATLWVVLDSKRRGKPIFHIVQLLIFFTWPISVPIYLVATRMLRGLGWAILNLVAVYAVTYLFVFGTVLLLYGPAGFYPR